MRVSKGPKPPMQLLSIAVRLSGFIPVVHSLIYMHVINAVLMGDAVNPTHMGDTLDVQMALLKGRVHGWRNRGTGRDLPLRTPLIPFPGWDLGGPNM